jgi:hypothetical protein
MYRCIKLIVIFPSPVGAPSFPSVEFALEHAPTVKEAISSKPRTVGFLFIGSTPSTFVFDSFRTVLYLASEIGYNIDQKKLVLKDFR